MTAATPTPTPDATDGDRAMRTTYWILGIVLVILCIIGLITYGAQEADAAAQQKAEQLANKLDQAGLPVPADLDIFVRSLGNDGGNVCDNPASALGRATLYDQITNGADFVGRRPVIVDPRIIQGEVLILETYCPEKLQEFRDELGDLKTDDTIKD
jgi:hypothetical protein